jgi:hypothetical protein
MLPRPSRDRLGSLMPRIRAIFPNVSLPASPYWAASGISPIPTLSRTIQMTRSNTTFERNTGLESPRNPCGAAWQAAADWQSARRELARSRTSTTDFREYGGLPIRRRLTTHVSAVKRRTPPLLSKWRCSNVVVWRQDLRGIPGGLETLDSLPIIGRGFP